MKIPNNRYLYTGLGIVLLLVVVYFVLFREDAVKVEAGKVTRGELTASIDAEGKTRYHERFTITAPISGRMFRINLHEGDRVPKGFVLTKIDPAPPRPVDPATTPDTGIHPFAYNVYIPQDGILTRIFVTSDGIVQAGTPIAELSKPSQLEVVADILSTDATNVKNHMPVLIENWGGSEPLKARVRTVEPQAFTKVSSLGVEEQRVNVIADLLSEAQGLGDNFRVDFKIILWEGKDVLRVPESALFRIGDNWNVFVVEGSRARLRRIEIGQRSPSYAQVVSGLNDGETVVLHPPNSVSDGTRVDVE
ncbi:MAG: HlyD family efflux transporter periplasmic adaptor subunit [Pyrinomonadaceae bacterium]|nr:HlyD family efflux transporter periplasmic adaptor subunit [Pyrinomonadaceae bacterium]